MASSFGGTVKLSGESEYRKALSNISAQLGVVSSQMNKVTAEFGKNDKSVQSLSAKDEVLNKKLESQQEKVSILRGALEQAKEEYGETDSKTMKWQKSLNNAEADVIKTKKEIDELGKEVEDSGKQAEKSAEGFTVFKGILANLGSQAIMSALSGLKDLGSAIINVGKQAITGYADYEQLVGGVETLFKDSAGIVQGYANNAYKTAGLSANEYMETVTSFSASLLKSLNGDTVKAAEVADMAMIDMSDNANKMGTSMESIQNAYQGFAKQNYTMLDNLKLGYGGTKEEMQRLLTDAEKISGIKYDISSFSDITEAIHVMQVEMGISGISAQEAAEAVASGAMTEEEAFEALGTTAKEASTTISGSINSWKSSFSNLLTGIADDNADFDTLINNFVESTMTVLQNLLPRINTTITGMGKMISKLIKELFPQLIPIIVDSIAEMTPIILDSLGSLLEMLVSMTPQILKTVIQIITDLSTTLGEQLPTLIPLVIQAVIDMTMALLDNIDLIIDAGIQLVMGLAEGLINALPQLIDKIPEIIDKLVNALVNNLPKLIEAGIQLTVMLAVGIVKAIPQLLSKIPQIISSLFNGFKTYYGKLGEIGLNILKGILNGFTSIGNFVWDAIKKVGNSMLDGIKKFFNIHSPARNDKLVYYSKMIAQGIGVSFTDEMKSVSQDMENAIPTDFDVTPTISTGFNSNKQYVAPINTDGGKETGNFTAVINNNSRYTTPSDNVRLLRQEYELYRLKYGKVGT